MVKPNWDTEELIENWTLLPQELELSKEKSRWQSNRLCTSTQALSTDGIFSRR